jgi:hypothetical protein
VRNTNRTTGGPINGKITANVLAKEIASIQQAIANSGLYVLGYVAIENIRNRVTSMKGVNHTPEALAWRLRRLLCTQHPSQSQRLKHEQRWRRESDVDHNSEQ